MENDLFNEEEKVLESCECALKEEGSLDFKDEFKSLFSNYEKLLKVARKLTRTSDITSKKLKEVNTKVIEQRAELKKAHDLIQEELKEAAKYVQALFPKPISEQDYAVDWRFIPCSSLGGDSFGYHWIDKNHFAFYLIDVTGHGVRAALLSASVINTLRSQTLPNTNFFEPGDVLTSLNIAFPQETQNYMNFTIWYGVYRKDTRTLTYSSGGHPPTLMFPANRYEFDEAIELSTRNTMIGLLPGIKFIQDSIVLKEESRLYVFSDGAYEVRLSNDKVLQYPQFTSILKELHSSQKLNLENLLIHTKSLCQTPEFEDDYTIMEIRLGV
ncbi:MAG: SpoIIE family protein phosphatase [Leptospiraceae bacterium]|nr:SpoIIE family protein phosphatase [Leptospiraceae bacterium]